MPINPFGEEIDDKGRVLKPVGVKQINHKRLFCRKINETLVNIILLFRGSEKPTFFEIFVIFLVEKSLV